MFGFFRRRAEYQKYARTVDNCLRVKFYGFPREVLAHHRSLIDIESMKRGSFKKGDTPAKECGVHAGRMILVKYVGLMPYEEKVTTAAAVDARDEHHPFCIAFAMLLDHTRQLTDEMHVRMIQYEFAGMMKGMTPEQRHSWWMETEWGSRAVALVTAVTRVGAKELQAALALAAVSPDHASPPAGGTSSA
jgi:hypothetical protein